jgi:putative multiple sugar transport system permease protein
MGTPLSIVCLLALGVAYGCGLGALIAYVHVPPWIATLAGYLAFRGLGTSILGVSSTNSISFKDSPDFLALFSGTLFKTPEGEMNWPCMGVGLVAAALVILLIFRNRSVRLRKGYEVDQLSMDVAKGVLSASAILLVMYKLSLPGGIPTVLVWVAAAVLFYSFITGKTTIGRHFYVVGGNIEAARLSGVNTKKIMFLAYLNMAILTSIAAMTTVTRFTAANADAGKNFEMDAISACVVGGVSASGGAGTVLGMVIGATLIGVINLGMFQINLDANYQRVVKGFVLLGNVLYHFIVILLSDLFHIVRNILDLDICTEVVCIDVSLHLNEVDDTSEVVLSTDRKLDRNGITLESVLHHVYNTVEVSAHDIHLVYVRHTGNLVVISLTPYCLRLRLNAALSAKYSYRTIEYTE